MRWPLRLPAPRSRLARACLVATGILVGQAVLFWPSLIGQKVLLPLDLLALPNAYLPSGPPYDRIEIHDRALSDEVFFYEPMRHFLAAEVRAGRLPLWLPQDYCGAPLAVFPKYSLFNLIYYLFPGPAAVVGMQFAMALVAGVGAYRFFRRALGAGFWPAALGAWAYPLTGFFVLWQGFYISYTVALYPWMLLAIDGVVRRPAGWCGPLLTLCTCLLLTVGAIDIAGQALLAAGLFAMVRLALRYVPARAWRRLLGAAVMLAIAWTIGFLIAAPYLLPMREYVVSGDRMHRRAAGTEERPPGGAFALPQFVLPLTYGSGQHDAFYLRRGNLLESAAGAYAGLLATLGLAPLAWAWRRRRALSLFWALQGLLGLAWCLDLPMVVRLLRAPGLNMFSHNRFTFLTGFAILALAVSGLDVLRKGVQKLGWWYLVPVGALVAALIWCLPRAIDPPLPPGLAPRSARQLSALPPQQRRVLQASQAELRSCHVLGIGWCLLGLGVVGATAQRKGPRPGLVLVTGGAVLAELLIFAWGRNPQADPSLYYPSLSPLEQLARLPPGRVLGVGCLPPMLNEMCALGDVRGYDGVDPHRLVDVLELARDRRFASPDYAVTQTYVPQVHATSAGKPRLPGALNMLNLRYLIGRHRPPGGLEPIIESDDYWVWENKEALPRAFVPAAVAQVCDEEMLPLLGNTSFDPGKVAYVEEPVSLPAHCEGTAEIVAEAPAHLTLQVDMKTLGLVVISDLWYEGWHATLDGKPLPTFRVNYALRGVVVPAGRATLEWHYWPQSLARGLQLLLAGVGGLVIWTGVILVYHLRARRRGGASHASLVSPAAAGPQAPTSPTEMATKGPPASPGKI